MLHPIFSTVLGHPELIGNHIANYAALFKDEAAAAGRGIVARAIAGALAAASALTALGLVGVAVMLGFMQQQFHWVLVVVPGVAVLIAALSGYFAARPVAFHGFADLHAQIDADVRALQLAKEIRHVE